MTKASSTMINTNPSTSKSRTAAVLERMSRISDALNSEFNKLRRAKSFGRMIRLTDIDAATQKAVFVVEADNEAMKLLADKIMNILLWADNAVTRHGLKAGRRVDFKLAVQVRKTARLIKHSGTAGQVWYQPETRTIIWVGSDKDAAGSDDADWTDPDDIEDMFMGIDGVDEVEIIYESPDTKRHILLFDPTAELRSKRLLEARDDKTPIRKTRRRK